MMFKTSAETDLDAEMIYRLTVKLDDKCCNKHDAESAITVIM